MGLHVIIDRSAICNCQIFRKIKILGQERLCHGWQINWIDEVSALDQVLELVNQLHGYLHVRVATHLIVKSFILLLPEL